MPGNSKYIIIYCSCWETMVYTPLIVLQIGNSSQSGMSNTLWSQPDVIRSIFSAQNVSLLIGIGKIDDLFTASTIATSLARLSCYLLSLLLGI